jgi:hypothetical protein
LKRRSSSMNGDVFGSEITIGIVVPGNEHPVRGR